MSGQEIQPESIGIATWFAINCTLYYLPTNIQQKLINESETSLDAVHIRVRMWFPTWSILKYVIEVSGYFPIKINQNRIWERRAGSLFLELKSFELGVWVSIDYLLDTFLFCSPVHLIIYYVYLNLIPIIRVSHRIGKEREHLSVGKGNNIWAIFLTLPAVASHDHLINMAFLLHLTHICLTLC